MDEIFVFEWLGLAMCFNLLGFLRVVGLTESVFYRLKSPNKHQHQQMRRTDKKIRSINLKNNRSTPLATVKHVVTVT